MIKLAIIGWNAAPGAPRNWQPERDGECGALPIRVFPPSAVNRETIDITKVQYCESAWQPTPEEMKMLNEGGSVILKVCGWQVPVALYVEPLKLES